MPAAPASRAAGREVTPVELFRLLPAHFAAVLVCTLLGGILAFAAARLAPRSYQAEAQLYVAAAQEGLTSGYAELQLTADYQELLTSRTMLESVISTLGLSTDTAHLKRPDYHSAPGRYPYSAHCCGRFLPTARSRYCQRTGCPCVG